jgi:hypothetical protein
MHVSKGAANRCLTVLFTVSALCLTLTAPASAGWFVEGSELTGSAALATTAAVDKTFVLTGGGLNLECSGSLSSTNPQIAAPAKLTAASITFSGCKTTNANCEVPATVTTGPVSSELAELTYPEDKAVFTPKTGTLFATVKYTGEKCAIAGNKPLSGKATTTLPTGQEEKVTQELKANTSVGSSELLIASSAAELTGAALLKLTSGSEFVGLFGGSSVDVVLDMPTNGKLTFGAKNAEGTIEYKNNEPAMTGKSWSTTEGDITGSSEYAITNNECVTKLILKPQEKCKFKVQLTVNPTGKTRIFFVHEAPPVSLKS